MAQGASLNATRRRFLVLLGVPALGMALVVTTVSTYLPVLVAEASGPVGVGLLIAGEGFFGIFMPTIVGARLDRVSHRVADRLPTLVVCAALVVGAMVAVGVAAGLGLRGFAVYAVLLVVLYAGYYSFLAPYWALYPDLVSDEESGRSRSAEGTLRVIGVALGLVVGGLLLDVAVSLPFLVAAAVCAVAVLVLVRSLAPYREGSVETDEGDQGSWQAVRGLLRDPGIRRLCVGEGLWNFALSSLRAFVVLFFTVGMGRSSTFVATVVFPLVAVGIAVAAPTAGWLSDRFGALRVLLVALVVYAVGMAVPGLTQASWVLVLIPVVAAGAAVVMTQPFALLMRLLHGRQHGAASGLFGFCRGLGATLGPILTGVAIVSLDGVLDGTDGYAAMWLACSAALLLSVPLVWLLRREPRLPR